MHGLPPFRSRHRDYAKPCRKSHGKSTCNQDPRDFSAGTPPIGAIDKFDEVLDLAGAKALEEV